QAGREHVPVIVLVERLPSGRVQRPGKAHPPAGRGTPPGPAGSAHGQAPAGATRGLSSPLWSFRPPRDPPPAPADPCGERVNAARSSKNGANGAPVARSSRILKRRPSVARKTVSAWAAGVTLIRSSPSESGPVRNAVSFTYSARGAGDTVW